MIISGQSKKAKTTRYSIVQSIHSKLNGFLKFRQIKPIITLFIEGLHKKLLNEGFLYIKEFGTFSVYKENERLHVRFVPDKVLLRGIKKTENKMKEIKDEQESILFR